MIGAENSADGCPGGSDELSAVRRPHPVRQGADQIRQFSVNVADCGGKRITQIGGIDGGLGRKQVRGQRNGDSAGDAARILVCEPGNVCNGRNQRVAIGTKPQAEGCRPHRRAVARLTDRRAMS